MTGYPSEAGVVVTADSALGIPAVYSCVNAISQTIAMFPLETMRRDANDQRLAADRHPLYQLLKNNPNRWQTSFEWRYWAISNMLLRGNSYSYIRRGGGGQVIELIPLETDRVTPMWVGDDEGRRIGYRYNGDSQQLDLLGPEVLHLRGMPDRDGLKGVSVIAYQRDVFGEAKAGQSYGARSMANGTTLKGVVKVPHPLDADTRDAIRTEWHRVYGGPSNANKVAVLGSEASFQPISMTMADAQYVEQRKLSRSDIGAIFRVPPVFYGDHEHSTFSNNEQQNLHFSTHCLGPWVKNIEQSMHRDLLTEREKGRYYFALNMNALMRADQKTRYEAYATLLQNGIASPNEIRSWEDMSRREGGDVYMLPLNMHQSGPDAENPNDDAALPEPEPEPEPERLPEPEPEEDDAAARALLTNIAERVVSRDVKAIKTGARRLRSKRNPDKVEEALAGCPDYFAKAFEPALAVIKTDSSAEGFAAKHRDRLTAAIAPAADAGDEAADRLECLVDEWARTAVVDIVSDILPKATVH